ncbi:MAG: hypothetical protein KBB83_05220 [Alphaproteobacteria bacterium]|nr:hypothetical protein [Alphaproteobacteria bacterium]
MIENTTRYLPLIILFFNILICKSWASQGNESCDDEFPKADCSSSRFMPYENVQAQMTTNTKQQPVKVAKVIQRKLRVTIKPEMPEEKAVRMEGIKRVKAQEEAAERLRAEEFDKYWYNRWGDPKEMEERDWLRHGRNNK